MALRKAKVNRTPDFVRVPYEFYKQAPVQYLNLIVTFFNNILISGNVPLSFISSITFPLHKKGDISSVCNYRGIAFMNTVDNYLQEFY